MEKVSFFLLTANETCFLLAFVLYIISNFPVFACLSTFVYASTLIPSSFALQIRASFL